MELGEKHQCSILLDLFNYISLNSVFIQKNTQSQKSQFHSIDLIKYCTHKFKLTIVQLSAVKIKSIKCTIKCCKKHISLCRTFRYCIH